MNFLARLYELAKLLKLPGIIEIDINRNRVEVHFVGVINGAKKRVTATFDHDTIYRIKNDEVLTQLTKLVNTFNAA